MYSTVPTQPYNAILTYSKDINHNYNYHKTAIQWYENKKSEKKWTLQWWWYYDIIVDVSIIYTYSVYFLYITILYN